jgi:hypothetical protein
MAKRMKTAGTGAGALTRIAGLTISLALCCYPIRGQSAAPSKPAPADKAKAQHDKKVEAERLKRFEALEAELENSSSAASDAQKSPCKGAAPNQDPRIPCHFAYFRQVLMGIGETQRFRMFDDHHNDVTAAAKWFVMDYGPLTEFSMVDGEPSIYAKKLGMVEVYGTYGGHSAEVRLYIMTLADINSEGRRGDPQFWDSSRPVEVVPEAPYAGRLK